MKVCDGHIITLHGVRHVPGCSQNLIYLFKLDSEGFRYSRCGGVLKIFWKSTMIMKGVRSRNLYSLVCQSMVDPISATTCEGKFTGNSVVGGIRPRKTRMIRKWILVEKSKDSLDLYNSWC